MTQRRVAEIEKFIPNGKRKIVIIVRVLWVEYSLKNQPKNRYSIKKNFWGKIKKYINDVMPFIELISIIYSIVNMLNAIC